MKVTCPHCLQEYDVEETLIEQIVQCEMCSQEFVALEEKQITETVKAKPDIPVKKEKKILSFMIIFLKYFLSLMCFI